MSKALQAQAKAVLGAVISALTSLGTVLVGDTSFGAVTAGQWVAVVLSGLIAYGAVFGITNKTG